jgi:periodic tryptophan protein 2
LENYDLMRQVAECKRKIRCMAVSPDHEYLFLGLHDGSIIGVKLEGSGPVYGLKGHSDVVSSVVLDPSGTHLLSGSWDRTVRVWSVDRQQQLAEGKLDAGITQVEWGPDEARAYSTDFAGSLTAWDWTP